MRGLAGIAFVFALTCAADSFADASINPATEIRLRNLPPPATSPTVIPYEQMQRINLLIDTAPSGLARLSQTELQPSDYAAAFDVVRLDRRLLLPAANQPNALMVNERTGADGRLRLKFRGHDYVIGQLTSTPDPKYGVQHLSARIINAAGYVWLTASERGDLIAGTIQVDGTAFRILSHSRLGAVIYRLTDGEGSLVQPTRYRSALGRNFAGITPELPDLERRHRQILALADIRPRYVRTSPGDSSVAIDGGELGSINVNEIDGQTVTEMMARLEPLTEVSTTNTEFRVVTVHGGSSLGQYDGEYAITFQQLVDGVPVAVPRQMTVANDGRVLSLSVRRVDDSFSRITGSIDAAEAWRLAEATLRREAGRRNGNNLDSIKHTPVVGEYRVNWERRSLSLFWTSAATLPDGRAYYVSVDSVTGVVSLQTAAANGLGEDFRQYICLRTSNSPVSCCNAESGAYGCIETPGASIAWREYNEASVECEPNDPAINCYDASLRTPKEIVEAVEAQWELAVGNTSSLCCHGIGGADNRIDVVVGTPAANATGAQFDRLNRNILIPEHPAANPEQSLARSVDVITHELVHALQNLNASLEGGHNASDQVAIAIKEGLADAMTGVMAEKITYGGHQWGEPWVFGDAPPSYPSVLQRDLRISRSFSRLYDTSLSVHDRGLAIGNFLYRIRQAFPSVTRFIEFQISVNRLIEDNHLTGFDLDDFRDAVDRSLKSGEASILNQINTVWAEMDDTVVVGGSRPAAPWFVDGSPLGCVGGYSTYMLGWSQVSGATYYEIWYYHNGVLQFEASDTSSPGYVYTTITADMRVKACNSNGCSALSADGFTVQHSQCF